MSYNYLPLDKNCLHFQQVKNLLKYNQHLSITFDAHERILKCKEYMDNKGLVDDEASSLSNSQPQNEIKISNSGGEEVSIEIVKLMLMLKIKSLSHGHCNVGIELVKRLMEMYNREIIPVIYSTNKPGTELTQLSLPLRGKGEIYYQGQKKLTAEVLKDQFWETFQLSGNEEHALTTGTHFTSANGLSILIKAEKLLNIANIIAAITIHSSGSNTLSFSKKLYSVSKHKIYEEIASTLSDYLKGNISGFQDDAESYSSLFFALVPQVHGACKSAYDYILQIFLNEINSVTENHVIFPYEELILNNENSIIPLKLGLKFLSSALEELGGLSAKRTTSLLQILEKNPGKIDAIEVKKSFYTIGEEIKKELNTLDHDYSNDFKRYFQVIKTVEKYLAIELLAASSIVLSKKSELASPVLNTFLNDFHNKIAFAEERFSIEIIYKTVDFITNYKEL